MSAAVKKDTENAMKKRKVQTKTRSSKIFIFFKHKSNKCNFISRSRNIHSHKHRIPEESLSTTSSTPNAPPTAITVVNSRGDNGKNLLGKIDTGSGVDQGGGGTEEMKRVAARKLIERYFFQLTDGCGNVKCTNKYCFSSGEVEKMNPDQAAARALTLFLQDAKLCDAPNPTKLAKTSYNSMDSDSISSSSSSDINNGR